MLKFLRFLLSFLALGGCASNYQIFDFDSDKSGISRLDPFTFNYDSFEIAYDFWADGGIMLFNLTNLSQRDLVLDLAASSFIFNGQQLSYVDHNQEKTELDTTSELVYSINFQADPQIKVPKQSNRWIEGFPTSVKWQKVGSNRPMETYKETDSPICFVNSLFLSFDDAPAFTIENEFWIAAVHLASKTRFQRISAMSKNLTDKSYLKRSTAKSPSTLWQDIAIDILQNILFIL